MARQLTLKPLESAIPLECDREFCKYSWNYRGNAKVWAVCPSCRGNVRVQKT